MIAAVALTTIGLGMTALVVRPWRVIDCAVIMSLWLAILLCVRCEFQ